MTPMNGESYARSNIEILSSLSEETLPFLMHIDFEIQDSRIAGVEKCMYFIQKKTGRISGRDCKNQLPCRMWMSYQQRITF